jgi:hypothetical protein
MTAAQFIQDKTKELVGDNLRYKILGQVQRTLRFRRLFILSSFSRRTSGLLKRIE